MSLVETQELTRLLNDLGPGNTEARLRLVHHIYDDLHRMAGRLMLGERADHTLQATALVHEAYLRLLGRDSVNWENRAQFYGAAAEVMRRILIDHARERAALKRGGGKQKVPLDFELCGAEHQPEELLAVDHLIAQLEESDPRKAEIVKLRFYASLTMEEIAAVLEVSVITVKRDWRFARAWLASRLNVDE